jgi:hypothetical protein
MKTTTSQQALFPQEKPRLNNGRYCTEEQYRVNMVMEENKRLRLERDKYFRMYMSIEKDNERLTRELMVLKSKIQDLM